MVRYRTRDLTRLLPGTARSMRRMEKITGRTDDMLILRGVNIFPTQIEEQVLAIAGLAPYFQIELYKTGPMDSMRVMTEAQPAAADGDDRKIAGERLAARIKEIVGVSCDVAVGEPGSVPRSQGKAVRVIDNRPKD